MTNRLSYLATFLIAGGACVGSGSGSGSDRPMPSGDGPIAITLHPNDARIVGNTEIVSFGVPFPRGSQPSVEGLVLVDANEREVPTHIETLLTWSTLDPAAPPDGSVRAALVSAEVEFPNESPMEFTLLRASTRTLEVGKPASATANWNDVLDEDFPVALAEPPVYATFTPEWLGAAGIRSYMTPVGDPQWDWFDDFMIGATATAVNDPSALGSEARIDVTDNEPWLFDRTMTLYNVYTRTGDVRHLRHAQRAAQFYATNLVGGYFQLTDGDDLKYSYGQALLQNYMLTGDARMLQHIEDIAAVGENWDPMYEVSDRFWTERHQTYALLAALSAWETTNAQRHADRVRDIVATTIASANTPADPSWPSDVGCVLHTLEDHEGDNSQEPICSPWMSALLAEAIWRYWLHSDDDEALRFLGDLAEFTSENALYLGGEGVGLIVPWYFASTTFTGTDSGPTADWEHSCDVAGMLARGAFARTQLGQSLGSIQTGLDDLLISCEGVLDNWHRSAAPQYRLSPSRKYNWWFGTTADLPWLVANLGT